MVSTVDTVYEKGVAPKPKKSFGVRHMQAVLLFAGLIVAYMMRVDMSVAIVAMNTKSPPSNTTHFNWPAQAEHTILSSFFWGYWVLQIPAGVLMSHVGGRMLLAISFGINTIVSLLLPLAALKGGWQAVCTCRVLQGLAQGFLYPTVHGLIGKWAPPSERGRLTTYIYAGAQLGTMLELMLAGYLAETSWGWPSIFYSVGFFGLLWTLLWIMIGANSPDSSRHISLEERDYIQTSLGQVGNDKHKFPVPWGEVLTSLPFYALLVAHCGQNYGFWTLLTEVPSYLKNVHKVDIKSIGLYSALSYLGLFLLSFVFSSVSDFGINRRIVNLTTARKISNSIGQWGPAMALIALAYSPANNVTVSVILLITTVTINAGHCVGYQVVHIDMASNFASTLMGITNCVANIVSSIAPLSVGALVIHTTSASEWRNVFLTASAVYFVCNLIFVIFGTCEEQSWNRVNTPALENGVILQNTSKDKKTDAGDK